MSVLSCEAIRERLQRDDCTALVVTPILDLKAQLGQASIDLRLGFYFSVDLRTREPVLDIQENNRPVERYFDHTFREFGGRFVLYPGQLVLGCTFEYMKLPNDLLGLLHSRSSLNRLGVRVSSVIQPGFVGTLTIELTNQSSNPVALYTGMRLVQLTLVTLDKATGKGYAGGFASKYVADASPTFPVSDPDFEKVLRLRG